MLCFHDSSKRTIGSFPHQTQLLYYGGNISVSIERIALEIFSGLPNTGIKTSMKSCQRNAVVYSFCRITEKKMLPLIMQIESILLHL